MKIAIISNRITEDIKQNQDRILHLATEAVASGAEFILFPETAATGLVISGIHEDDFKISEAIPGPRNEQWRRFSEEHGTYFGAGLIEREENKIFDSAVLFNPSGELILHYRRNDQAWHSPDDDPSIYCEGNQIPVADSPIGKLAFLICGDLWNDEIVRKLNAKKPNHLLYIFARDIEPREEVRSIWNSEFQAYKERWEKTNSNVLAVNLLSDIHDFGSIGGAWYIDNMGKLLSSSSILEEHVLFIDI